MFAGAGAEAEEGAEAGAAVESGGTYGLCGHFGGHILSFFRGSFWVVFLGDNFGGLF